MVHVILKDYTHICKLDLPHYTLYIYTLGEKLEESAQLYGIQHKKGKCINQAILSGLLISRIGGHMEQLLAYSAVCIYPSNRSKAFLTGMASDKSHT
jgi:hypothetical protein